MRSLLLYFLLQLYLGLLRLFLHVFSIYLFETFQQRREKLLSRWSWSWRQQFFNINFVLLENLLVIWSWSQLRKSNSRSLRQHTSLPQQLLIVFLYLIVLLSHTRHPQSSLMNKILKHLSILLKHLQLWIFLHILKMRKLLYLILIQLHPQLLYFLTQHSRILIEIILTIRQLSHMQLTLLQLFLQRWYLLLQRCDVSKLFFTRMILVIVDLVG